MNEFSSHFNRNVAFSVKQGEYASPNTFARFKNRNGETCASQFGSSREPGRARSNDDHIGIVGHSKKAFSAGRASVVRCCSILHWVQ
jgi:hypothetical protein